MKPFISLCMIVKNEEKVIERCLSSVAHLVDEVVIVDTGSTDNTKEIVLRYTSNIYDFHWINDFSAARNYVASKATGKWILVLDADEYVDEENFNDFINELRVNETKNIDAYTAKILNFTGSFAEGLVQNYHDRVYKNNRKISYYRSIHEQFKKNDDTKLTVVNSSLLIFHSGYLNQTVSEKEKKVRNKELLDKEFNEGNNKAFDYFNFGNEYCSRGEYGQALDAYLEAYRLKSDFRLSWVSVTLVQVTICLLRLHRYNDALNVISDAESLYSTSPEFPFLKGEVMLARGQLDDARHYFQHIINNKHNYTHILLRPDLKDQLPHRRLGEIYLYEEDYQNSIFNYVSVLNSNKYCQESISKVIFILNKFHTIDEITEFLISKELIDDKNLKIYVSSCFDVGNFDLALAIIKNKTIGTKDTLYCIANLKKLTISNGNDLDKVLEILKPRTFEDLYTSGWINIVDIYLLRNKLRNINQYSKLNFLEDDDNLNTLENYLENKITEIEDSLFITALKYFIDYKQFAYCDSLLEHTENLKEESRVKIASILFEKEFKAEALHFYNMVNWNLLHAQDFINIISCLIETKEIDNALQISEYAIQKYPTDFRFYKYFLENSTQEDIFTNILIKARELFNESVFLERYFI